MNDRAEKQEAPTSSVNRERHLDPAQSRTDLKHHKNNIKNPKDQNDRNTPDGHFEPL